MPFTYIVQCSDGSFYTGWTTNLTNRLKAHNDGTGARYTRCRRPVHLVYWEEQPDRSQAQQREDYLRHLTRTQKELLVVSFKKNNHHHYVVTNKEEF